MSCSYATVGGTETEDSEEACYNDVESAPKEGNCPVDACVLEIYGECNNAMGGNEWCEFTDEKLERRCATDRPDITWG